MPTGDVMRLTLEGTFDGEPTVIGFGFVSNSGLGSFQEDSDALIQEFNGVMGFDATPSAYLAPLSVHYQVTGVRVQDLSPGVAASNVSAFGQLGGNTVDDALPPNDALCITWRTGLKGKQNRGRSYLTGFAEDSQVSGYWISEIQAWATSVIGNGLMAAFGPLGSGNYALSVVHTMSGGARIIPPTATPIVSYTVHNEVRTLRRRAIGVRISRHRSAP
jgi:hypothetical protein